MGEKYIDGKDWIKGAIKNKGSLHKDLKVPMGKKIPSEKLKKATHSKNASIRKKAVLAETLKNMHSGK